MYPETWQYFVFEKSHFLPNFCLGLAICQSCCLFSVVVPFTAADTHYFLTAFDSQNPPKIKEKKMLRMGYILSSIPSKTLVMSEGSVALCPLSNHISDWNALDCWPLLKHSVVLKWKKKKKKGGVLKSYSWFLFIIILTFTKKNHKMSLLPVQNLTE